MPRFGLFNPHQIKRSYTNPSSIVIIIIIVVVVVIIIIIIIIIIYSSFAPRGA
jgi:hypothetical protein